MAIAKSNVKIDYISLTLEEQIIEAALKKKPKVTDLEVDDKGNIIIDKDTQPELYDWAVNG